MREIKFRAWDKDRMVKGFELFEDNSAYRGAIPMQFTGLLDKNGKEIYEGDIVKYQANGNEVIDSVIYIDSFFGVEKFTGMLSSFYPIEVIGNIYKNPELIKAVEEKE